ncbi:MAG TPA: toll/interleukin-1 receptor domain-containing protein [Caulobacteraceae bacterium]|jgi:hypothetical protein
MTTDVFISYKREDEVRVARLAQALEKAGFTIWWDRGLPGAESWRENIGAALAEARCVVVVWSHGSVGPEGAFVRDEAGRAMARGLLVPVSIDRVGPPLGFGELQAIDLTRWRGAQGDPFFRDLVGVIRAKLDNGPTPKPQGPTARVARRLFYGGVSSASLAAFAAFAFNTFGVASNLCTLPAAQPGLSDTCGAVGLGGRPSQTERLAWAAIPKGSCQALRDHVARFPTGAYAHEAADLITARKVSTVDTWSPSTRSLALYQPQTATGPDQPAAQAAALKAAQTQADQLCQGFAAATSFRFHAATPQPQTWNCSTAAGKVTCGFSGMVTCTLDERATVQKETCG